MKEKLKTVLLYGFVIIIVLLVVASLVMSIFGIGLNVFEFLKNAVLTLGNGRIFVGILITILTLFGLANSIIGLFRPPQWLNDWFDNAPSWLGQIYVVLSLLGTVALFYVFINHII